VRRVRDDGQIHHRRKEVATCVALLDDTGAEATQLDREVLECGGGGETPDPPHRDTEQGTDGKELRERLYEARCDLDRAAEEQVNNKWPFSTEAVRENSKDDLYHWREGVNVGTVWCVDQSILHQRI